MENKQLCHLEGSVDSIAYKNEVNGFAVLTLDANGEPITVVGEIGDVEEGEELRLTGEYSNHPKYGAQFKAHLCERTLPTSIAAIQRYLASGVIKGIGPVLAKKIVKKFGEETFDIFENQPERLTEVDGITKKKADKFVEEFKNVYGIRTLMSYLSKYSVAPSYGVRAWKRWGLSTLDMINTNPYILCRFGIELPFEKADEIAIELDIPRDNENRISAGIACILTENSYSGHTCLPYDRLRDKACEVLEITPDNFDKVLENEIECQNFVDYNKNNRRFIYLAEFFIAESYIARRLSYMKNNLYNSNINFDEVINIDEKQNGIKYETLQREAINKALQNGFMILTGGPGTGKTTTLNAIISLFEQQGLQVFITAPTGRAAKRISDLTGYEAKTIHRLLDFQPSNSDKFSFVHNENNLLDCDVIIIDEMSMVDVLLFEALLRAMPLSCKLIMVGDSDQLPSVGAGNLLKDLIDSEVVPAVKLTQIFRQAEESSIVKNAHLINNGEMPDLKQKDNDFFFLQRLDYDEITETIIELQKDRLPKTYGFSPLDDIQVLCPTRKGPIGVYELNKKLQAVLNPPSKYVSELRMPNYIFRENDKVMQTKNNYDITWEREDEKGSGIFNGDIGKIIEVDRLSGTVKIDFEGRICTYNSAMLENLELAYAVTVHKSQGSEFDVVILPLFGGYDKLYFRNLLYTAVTRAKKLLIIVGSAKRVEFMIANNRRTCRYTCLKDMLVKDSYDEYEATI